MSPRPRRRARSAAGLLLAGLAVLASALPAAAGIPAPSDGAWVVVRRPAASYTVPRADRRTSGGGPVTVERVAAGHWYVRIPGVFPGAPNWGHVQVTPMGAALVHCWTAVPTTDGLGTAEIEVRCVDRFDVSVDARFALTYVRHTGVTAVTPVFGYALLDAPGASGTPTPFYQATTGGGTVTNTRTAEGRHILTFGSVADARYVAITPVAGPAACRVVTWYPSGADTGVEILCRSAFADAPLDRQVFVFAGAYAMSRGFTALRADIAYLWANQPTAARYLPASGYRYATAGRSPRILRRGTGVYEVRLRGLPPGGAAIVNAYGEGTATCQLGAIPKSTPARVIVRCFTPSGSPANERFTLGWVR